MVFRFGSMSTLGWMKKLESLAQGDRVVLALPNGEALAEAILACFELELVAVPCHPRSSRAAIEEIAVRVGACVVVKAEGDKIEATDGPAPRHSDEAEGLALIMFTSGSTGNPKGVKLSRDSLVGNARVVADLHNFSKDRPHGTCLPLFHINAIAMSLIGTHLAGSPLVLASRFDPTEYFELLNAESVTTASIVPALLEDLLRIAPKWPSNLEYLITAAAPLKQDVARRFNEAYGPRLRQGYGLTETVNFSFMAPVLGAEEWEAAYVEEYPPVGIPVAGTDFRIVDGEVHIKSQDMMSGYWEDPESTNDAIGPDGWLRTGDKGYVSDGYLRLQGRTKEQINRGGETFFPIDLETEWTRTLDGKNFAAVAVEESQIGAEIGIVGDLHPISQALPLLNLPVARPVVASNAEFVVTSTGKPQRRQMAQGLFAKSENAQRYNEILGYSTAAAIRMIEQGVTAGNEQARHMLHQMERLAELSPHREAANLGRKDAVHETFDLLEEMWPSFATGEISGAEIMHLRPGLWKRLMREWPLASYAELMAGVLVQGGHLSGRVLEVGSGVGNTTTLISDHLNDEFVWSDKVPELVSRRSWPGKGAVFDLDLPPTNQVSGKFDTIFGTNVVHCVSDKKSTLTNLRELLSPGGRLILSEGNSPTKDGIPWALDYMCSMWDGWWDQGGFISREGWIDLLQLSGFEVDGYSAMFAGSNDLGGAIWAHAR